MTRSTKKTVIKPIPPERAKETSDQVAQEVRAIRDILAELMSFVREAARHPTAEAPLSEGAPYALDRLKHEIKSELWQELNHLKLKIARLEQKRLGPKGRSKLLNAMSFDDFNRKFKPNRTAFDWLSRDTASVDAYVDDPLCGFMVTTTTWVVLLDALGDLLSPKNLARVRTDLPIFILSGTDDPVGDMGRGPLRLADSYRAAGLRDVELKLYVGGRHEMLHETNRDEVVVDVVSWIHRALGRLAAR